MKPAPFAYVRADEPEQIVSLLAEHGEDARVLAGGQSLGAVLNMRLAKPSLLIDLSRSASLATMREHRGCLEIGAAATQAALEWRPGLARDLPLLHQAIPNISHFQIRNRGTVCGSLAHADPSAELALCLVALRGELVLANAKRQRTVAADRFFTGLLSTERADDELLLAARYPIAAANDAHGFVEHSMRHGDFAICAAAAVITDRGLRLAVGGVADRPIAQDWARNLDGDALEDALNEFAWSLDARDDPLITAATRRHLVRTLGRRAVGIARSRLASRLGHLEILPA
ncbi:FAD binding domain-containing protein [soil metagenome]